LPISKAAEAGSVWPSPSHRASTAVNREFETLSRISTLAIALDQADTSPCARVKRFKLDNERYRYLDPGEETLLMAKRPAGETDSDAALPQEEGR